METNMIVVFPFVALIGLVFLGLLLVVLFSRRRVLGAALLMLSLFLISMVSLSVLYLSRATVIPATVIPATSTGHWNSSYPGDVRWVDAQVMVHPEAPPAPAAPQSPLPPGYVHAQVGDAQAVAVVDESTSLPPANVDVTTDAAPLASPEVPAGNEVPLSPAAVEPIAAAVASEPVPPSAEPPVDQALVVAPSELTADTDLTELQTETPATPSEITPAAPSEAAPSEAFAATAESPAASTLPAFPEPATPVWVTNPPQTMHGNLAMTLVSDPFDNRFDCDRDLDSRTRLALRQFAREYCDSLSLPLDLELSVRPQDLAAVNKQRHYALRETSVGTMQQAYQLTVFDEEVRQSLQDRIHDALAERRLAATGVFSGGVLSLVSIVYGICRFSARKARDPFAV